MILLLSIPDLPAEFLLGDNIPNLDQVAQIVFQENLFGNVLRHLEPTNVSSCFKERLRETDYIWALRSKE